MRYFEIFLLNWCHGFNQQCKKAHSPFSQFWSYDVVGSKTMCVEKKFMLTKVTVGMSKVLWATLICVKGVEKGERIRTYWGVQAQWSTQLYYLG